MIVNVTGSNPLAGPKLFFLRDLAHLEDASVLLRGNVSYTSGIRSLTSSLLPGHVTRMPCAVDTLLSTNYQIPTTEQHSKPNTSSGIAETIHPRTLQPYNPRTPKPQSYGFKPPWCASHDAAGIKNHLSHDELGHDVRLCAGMLKFCRACGCCQRQQFYLYVAGQGKRKAARVDW